MRIYFILDGSGDGNRNVFGLQFFCGLSCYYYDGHWFQSVLQTMTVRESWRKSRMDTIRLANLNYAECARYLGYGTSSPDETVLRMMRECEEEVCETANPRFVYKVFPISRNEVGIALEGSSLVLTGNSIQEHLSGCHKAVLLCATLSDKIDRLIRRTELSDMAKAVIMDAMAAVAVEQLCDRAEEMIRSEYESHEEQAYFTWRFGFGYGDLPLQEEPLALKLLDADKRIGVNINDSLIMFPRKTTACIIGISDSEIKTAKRGCISCNMKESCKFRQRGERCGF
jgi:5-methyltetrahydrofolate--homocysteine methyltransferase